MVMGRREWMCGAGAVVFAGMVPAAGAEGRGCTAWVGEVMERMFRVKAGMTRTELLKVFGEQGGLRTRMQETVVSRECRYFQVDVEFVEEAGWRWDGEGRVIGEVEGTDVIRTISRPYLAWEVMD